MIKLTIILLNLFLLSNCTTVKDVLNIEPLPKVEIIKHSAPSFIVVNDTESWEIWVTKETKYIQLLYYEKQLYSNKLWYLVHNSEIINLIEGNYVMDKEHKKCTARFGPLKYTGEYRVDIRAWNDYGIWDTRQKDELSVFVTVEYGVGHGH